MKSAKALLAAALIGSTIVSGSAVAARLSATSTDSVKMVRINGATGDPVFGERVTFRISTSIASPFVLNECKRNGVVVSSELHGFFDGSLWGTTYSLGPTTLWQAGAADCTASLIDQSRKRTRVLATTSFHVTGS